MSAVKPIDDPLELRDAIASDRKAAYERLGAEVPFELAQAIATADLMLVDRAEAEGDIKHQPTKTAKDKPEIKPESRSVSNPDQVVSQSRFVKAPVPDGPGVNEVAQDYVYAKLAGLSREKFNAVKARIALLTKKVADYDPARPFDHMAYPKYGKLAAMMSCDYAAGTGVFARIPDPVARFAICFRLLEDICDKSNADAGLPNWWVK